MPKPRRQGDSSDDSVVGNFDQSQKQPARIIKALESPLFTAVITAIGALVVFGYNRIVEVDARLDELEKEARIILGADGQINASPEAMESFYGVQELRRRIERIERIHAKGH